MSLTREEVLKAIEVLRSYVLAEPPQPVGDDAATTLDFGDGKGPVAAHRHRNPDGSLGGWIADTAYVAPTAHVSPDAVIYSNAWVGHNAHVGDGVRVRGTVLSSRDRR